MPDKEHIQNQVTFQCHFPFPVAKAVLALPQGLDQCEGIIILDQRKRIVCISTTLLTGL